MHREEGIAVKDKKYKIGGIIGAVAVVVILGAFALIRSWQGQKPVAEKIGQLPDGQEQGKETVRVHFFFDYDGTKDLQCTISGHSMTVETGGFTFGEEISKRFPTGNLFPAKKQEKMTMHFYVFNDLEKALEEMEK